MASINRTHEIKINPSIAFMSKSKYEVSEVKLINEVIKEYSFIIMLIASFCIT
jgi:hypothetical protein